MSRPARPPTNLAESLRRSLGAYLQANGLTITSFARTHGLQQSTLHRFWRGTTKEPSSLILPALRYAQNAVNAQAELDRPSRETIDALVAETTTSAYEATVLRQLVYALAPIVTSLCATVGQERAVASGGPVT